jgi:tetratricopeptide (TPR) repeat protein
MTRSFRLQLFISLFLTLFTAALFFQVLSSDFVAIDDNAYVTRNPYVQSGLTKKSVVWAFTTLQAEFWHPLTWSSYMLDTHIFGVTAKGYHFTNLLLHIFNTLLLFFFLNKTTGFVWRSGFVAALFALHPLHVESVAWIAQRKDVLSTFFWLLTLLSYARFVERPVFRRYAALFLFFILGLMAKPMLITLPFVLLLLDFWPLRRCQYLGSMHKFIDRMWPCVREKLPLFGVAAAAGVITYIAQKHGGGLSELSPYPLTDRIANALVAYGVYIWKMIWPQKLAFFYPFANDLPIWQVTTVTLVLALITALAVKSTKDKPYFISGWLWYIGTLVPVIGLVTIGDFAAADRYTYVPLIGLFIIIAWGIPDLLKKWRFRAVALGFGASVVLICLASVTWFQLRTWSDSTHLFEHALKVTKNNFLAHHALGNILAGQGQFKAAISHFKAAVKIRPDKATLHSELGRALASQGRFDQSIPHLQAALRIKPNDAETHYTIGLVFVAKNRLEKAIFHLSESLRLNPELSSNHRIGDEDQTAAYFNTGELYEHEGHIDRAIGAYKQALALRANPIPAIVRLAALYTAKADYKTALALFEVDTSIEGLKQALVAGYRKWDLLKMTSWR